MAILFCRTIKCFILPHFSLILWDEAYQLPSSGKSFCYLEERVIRHQEKFLLITGIEPAGKSGAAGQSGLTLIMLAGMEQGEPSSDTKDIQSALKSADL